MIQFILYNVARGWKLFGHRLFVQYIRITRKSCKNTISWQFRALKWSLLIIIDIQQISFYIYFHWKINGWLF